MLTSKQRASLRALANGIDTVMQIGKGGVTESVVLQARQAISNKELIKVRVLESACPGQDCVHAGQISRAGGRIICLPNRLVVSLMGSGGEVDAVTG